MNDYQKTELSLVSDEMIRQGCRTCGEQHIAAWQARQNCFVNRSPLANYDMHRLEQALEELDLDPEVEQRIRAIARPLGWPKKDIEAEILTWHEQEGLFTYDEVMTLVRVF